MPRRPLQPAQEPVTGTRPRPGPRVHSRAVKARLLVTFGPTHGVWGRGGPIIDDWKGAIVRLAPPAEASPELVAQVKRELLKRGAAAVTVVPATVPGVLVGQEWPEPEVTERRPMREVVLEIANEVNTKDRKALLARIEETMAEVGL
jgi:hypothetical protein